MSLWRKPNKKDSAAEESQQEPQNTAAPVRRDGVAFFKEQLRQFKQHGRSSGVKTSDGVGMIQREEVESFISDPTALDSLSDDHLEHLRVIVEGSLEANERDLTDDEKEYLRVRSNPGLEMHLSVPIVGDIFKHWLPDTPKKKQEFIDRLRVLLKLIESKQARRAEAPRETPAAIVPTEVQERERVLDKIEGLRSQRNSRRSKMQLSGATEDEIRRFENMYDNAIHELEIELQKLLMK